MTFLSALESWNILLQWHVTSSQELQSLTSKTQRHWIRALISLQMPTDKEQAQYFEAVVNPIKVLQFFSIHLPYLERVSIFENSRIPTNLCHA